ncbi:hypothetical protein A4A49_04842 [Nicotiana attenuata]|uniref:Retrovirus-related Pol polyprotein from transposon TNT 1-94-like beta-barrel domain-containing protein n=1 Tax=Nicotiana attenuata TaxID=49451 RepID=A0A1J6I9E5_NICAT|nr:hypothetical protein A4A49_04842 [Nicotiana attenuata]
MTPNAGNLSSVSPYTGFDRVVVGNGSQLPISFTGNGTISTPSSFFSLNNVLIVPNLSTNLLSVRKFTSDNKCSIEFDSCGFSIKDIKTKKTLLRCNSLRPLYSFSSFIGDVASKAFVAVRLSLVLCH